MRKKLAGFYVISAVFFLVLLSLLGAYMLQFSILQQTAGTQDFLSVKALQAARSGIEWGIFQVGRNSSCTVAGSDFSPGFGLADFTVSVKASTQGPYDEAGTAIRICSITATACNSPTAGVCPGNSATIYYVERELTASIAY